MRETCEQCGLTRPTTCLVGQPPNKVRICSVCMLRALEEMAASAGPCPSLSPYSHGPCFGKEGHGGVHEDPGGIWTDAEAYHPAENT